jgi:hypothetical protein
MVLKKLHKRLKLLVNQKILQKLLLLKVLKKQHKELQEKPDI